MGKLTQAMVMGMALVAVAGCSRNRAPAELPPVDESSYNTGTTSTGGVSNAVVPGSQQDFVASISSDTIYFDTDRYNVDDIDRAALASQAQWLARYPNVRITVEGHADERGTRDYNLALGERRANAARNYLASLGVDAARISVVSFGKERPIALGSDEASWAQNRRAVTVTVQ
ncbi:MAG: peptidoglycan-associated lipoprotein Pal [Pseudomonadota bacterium]